MSALLVALAWVALFELNDYLFGFAEVSANISWVFLPAALRMLAVVCLGWMGVVGLFLGAMITNAMADAPLVHSLITSALSSVPALAAATVTTRFLGLPPDLRGLKAPQLFWFALIGSGFNVLAHSVYFHLADTGQSPAVLPMLTGDLIGTFLMLWGASFLLRRFTPPPRGA